jgi:hypothetical protein
MPRPSGTVHTPALAISPGAAPLTCDPATWTQPDFGTSRPPATWTVVLLPAPLVPSSAMTLPRGIWRVMPWSTSMRP